MQLGTLCSTSLWLGVRAGVWGHLDVTSVPSDSGHTLICFLFFAATNLNGGLLQGIEILNKAQGSLPELSNHTSILIMLTDGEPTEGKRPEGYLGKW